MIRDGKLGVSGEDEMTGSDRCRPGEAWGRFGLWTNHFAAYPNVASANKWGDQTAY